MTANILVTGVRSDSIHGTFMDIMTDPMATYEVIISDTQGQTLETLTYQDADVINGLINFDFANLQPDSDYTVDLRVVTGGTTYNLDSVSTRTTSKIYPSWLQTFCTGYASNLCHFY